MPGAAPKTTRIRALDRAASATLADEYATRHTVDGRAPSTEQVLELADGLRAHRLFDQVRTVADAAKAQGVRSLKLTRLRAQALIEAGELEPARTLLQDLLDSHEGLEARGLLGRIWKQRYIDQVIRARSADADALAQSIAAYLGAYESDPTKPVWHGINAVAMLSRARRDGVAAARGAEVPRIAREILDQLERDFARGRAEYWDLATAGEAQLALGETDLAELWFRRCIDAPDAEPFKLASTLRQLQEVWGLNAEEPPGRLLLPPIDRALARAGQVLLTPDAVQDSDAQTLEKRFGNAGFISPKNLELGLARCLAVARIEDDTGQACGTGFAVSGAALKEGWGTDFVLVTNHHVIPDEIEAPRAHATFYALQTRGRPFTTRLGAVLDSSPVENLDVTIVRLAKQPTKIAPYPLADRLPAPDGTQHAFVIGHPNGGDLMFSLQENILVDHGAPDDPRVHYRTPTEPGSSGSPVFDTGWNLIAVHHKGSDTLKKIHGDGTYGANEGMWIQAVKQWLEPRKSS